MTPNRIELAIDTFNSPFDYFAFRIFSSQLAHNSCQKKRERMSEKKKCTLAENILDILQMELKI